MLTFIAYLLLLLLLLFILFIFCNCLIDAQVGQAELYIRLVNSRDVTSQDALNAQPIQHYVYKYPVLVSGHSGLSGHSGQAKLVKKYAKNSPARKLLVVCLTCCQAHLKEKTQFIRPFLKGRVFGGRSSNTLSYNAPWAIHHRHGIRTFWSYGSIPWLPEFFLLTF